MQNRARLEQLEKTYSFNELTAVVSPSATKHALIVCLPKEKAPASVSVQPVNMGVRDVRNVITNGGYNVGHAITTRQLDVDFDTDNRAAVEAFRYFLPQTPYRIGRKSKPDSHWIYNLVEDFHEVAPIYKHVVRFLAQEFKIAGKPVKIEYRYRTHKDNDFTSRLPAENPYVFAPGSIHTSGELVEWSAAFKSDLTAVNFDTGFLFKRTVLAIIASLVAPHWCPGSRQYMAMALAGTLHRMSNVTAPDSETPGLRFTDLDFEELIKGICHLANDDEVGPRVQTFKQTWRKSENPDAKTTGATSLKRYLGTDGAYILNVMYELITGVYSEVNVQELYERYFIVRGTGMIVDAKRISARVTWYMTKQGFADTYASKWVTWQGKPMKLAKWCYEAGILDYIDGADAFPPEKLTLDDYKEEREINFWDVENEHHLNVWKPYALAPHAEPIRPEEVQPFLDYIREIFGTSNEKYSYLMAWMANLIQSPKNKPRTYPIIIGQSGAGKSFLFENFLVPILGDNAAVTTDDMEGLLSGYNSLLKSKTLAVFEEAINHSRREVAARLKQFITGSRMVLREKYAPEREINNFCRAVFISNDVEQAVAIDANMGERRACVFKVSEAKVGDKEYFAQLKKWADKNLDKVHRFLLDYSYNPAILETAIQNEEKSVMQTFSLMHECPEVFWIMERLEDGYPLDTGKRREWWHAYRDADADALAEGLTIDNGEWPDRISESALRADLQDWAVKNGVPRNKMAGLKNRLRNVFPYLRQQHRICYETMVEHKRTYVKPVVCAFPTRVEILDHLRPRYGHVFPASLKDTGKLEEKDFRQVQGLSI